MSFAVVTGAGAVAGAAGAATVAGAAAAADVSAGTEGVGGPAKPNKSSIKAGAAEWVLLVEWLGTRPPVRST